MRANNYHLFSDGSTHIAYDQNEMIIYRIDDETWQNPDKLQNSNGQPEKTAAAPKPDPVTQESPSNSWFLERLVLILTTDCNLRCSYCYAEGGDYGLKREKMTKQMAQKSIQWATEVFAGIGTIQFFGGEPTLNPSAMEAVYDAFELKKTDENLTDQLQYAIVTNGTYWNDHLDKLVDRQPIHITFSIDGPKVVHDANRYFASGKGCHDDTIKNFLEFQEYCTQSKSSLGVEMTFTPQALDAGWGVWELAQYSSQELGLSEAHIAPVTTEPDDTNCWLERIPEISQSYRTATKNSLQSIMAGEYIGFSVAAGMLRTLITKRNREVICPAGVGTLAVDPSGEVYPCFMFTGQPDKVICNVNSAPDLQVIRQRILDFAQYNFKHTHPTCRSCWAIKICSGCVGDTEISMGSLEKESPVLCSIMKNVAEETMLFLGQVQSDPEQWAIFVENYKKFRLNVENKTQTVI
ncbi:MAG: radical SAM protein [Anaerolineae bacterium]|nr:radical SAM protein [Anaerolineae bacterium]